MALFGSDKKAKTLGKVRPTVVRTQNVAKEILNIAKSYNIKPELLDFNLLDVHTYTRINDAEEETEWQEVAPEDLSKFDIEKTFLNPDFHMKQTYEIEIFSKRLDEDDFKNFKATVGANTTKCKIYLSISAGSSVDYHSRFEDDFLDFINKKKIRSGILVYIFDAMLSDEVFKFSARTRVAEHLEIQKSEMHLIAKGIEPTPTINDALILHFEKKEEVDENEKIDYASRGFIQSVLKDELLIEYIKPQLGKPGRNCRGEYLKPPEPLIKNEPKFQIDYTIRMNEDEKSIKYYANVNGYIAFENGTYLIKKEIDVREVSFKTTGSICSGVDSDVDMSVKETDAVKDAIGTGVIVEVTKIIIEGNVGSNAKVVAKKAEVHGQTHNSASITADDLDINVHKGKAIGKNVHITRLEHGEVEGENIKVEQALGGIIRGKEIDIGICDSHVKVTAIKRIEIQKLQGSENTFTIDPLLQKDAQKSLVSNEKKIKRLELKLKELQDELKKQSELIQEATPAFMDIKKRLLRYKTNGVKMPDSFVKKYKQFQSMQEKEKSLKAETDATESELNLLIASASSFQEHILKARIINKDKWIGYNEIRFKLVEPPIELVYKPKDGSVEHIIGLVKLDEEEYEIRPIQEKGNEKE